MLDAGPQAGYNRDMADMFTPEYRSWIMSRIRSRNTRPELMVRMILHRLGYRFSLRRKDLPGTPDIVLPLHRAVVFVHGCFWHRHPRCKVATKPTTRPAFWRAKFTRNVGRDKANLRAVRRRGWRAMVVWECQVLKDPMKVARRLDTFLRRTADERPRPFVYDLPTRSQMLKAAEKKADYNVKPRRG